MASPSLPITDTRAYFRPVSAALADLLRTLPESAWLRPTVAGRWVVRDVVAHLTDITLRRLSFHRDRMAPPPPEIAITSERDFVRFINGINADWVKASQRLSPRVLTDLFALASSDLADWFESLPADTPGLFGVSWAGEQESEGWFDIGREFTELWHHQQQVRMAVEAPSLDEPRYLRAVIEIALRGLPHAFRDVPAEAGMALVLEVTGQSGGTWTIVLDTDRWALVEGDHAAPTTRVRLSDDDVWKLLFNALPAEQVHARLTVTGDPRLAESLAGARSIVI